MITRNKHDLSPGRVNAAAVGWLHFRRATQQGEKGEERVGDGGGWFADYCAEQVIILSATAIDFERWQESTTECLVGYPKEYDHG